MSEWSECWWFKWLCPSCPPAAKERQQWHVRDSWSRSWLGQDTLPPNNPKCRQEYLEGWLQIRPCRLVWSRNLLCHLSRSYLREDQRPRLGSRLYHWSQSEPWEDKAYALALHHQCDLQPPSLCKVSGPESSWKLAESTRIWLHQLSTRCLWSGVCHLQSRPCGFNEGLLPAWPSPSSSLRQLERTFESSAIPCSNVARDIQFRMPGKDRQSQWRMKPSPQKGCSPLPGLEVCLQISFHLHSTIFYHWIRSSYWFHFTVDSRVFQTWCNLEWLCTSPLWKLIGCMHHFLCADICVANICRYRHQRFDALCVRPFQGQDWRWAIGQGGILALYPKYWWNTPRSQLLGYSTDTVRGCSRGFHWSGQMRAVSWLSTFCDVWHVVLSFCRSFILSDCYPWNEMKQIGSQASVWLCNVADDCRCICVFEHVCRTPSVSFMVICSSSSLEHAAYASEVVLKEEYRFRTLRTCQSVSQWILGFRHALTMFGHVWFRISGYCISYNYPKYPQIMHFEEESTFGASCGCLNSG